MPNSYSHNIYSGRHGNGSRSNKVISSKNNSSSRSDNHKKPVSDSKIYVGVFAFIVFIFYIAGYLFTYLNKQNVSVEIAQLGTIDMPKTLKGVIVRDEVVVFADIEGDVIYEFSENERVKLGSLVATIKNTELTNDIERQIAQLDDDILKKQKMREDISFFASDVAYINNKIKNIFDNNIPKFIQENTSNLYLLKDQLKKEITTRNRLLLTDDKSSLSGLIEEKSAIESNLANNIGSCLAPKSGVLSFNVDGFENVFTIEQLANLSEDQTKMSVSVDIDLQKKVVAKNEPIFKIITSNDWYLSSYISNADVEGWAEGQMKNILISLDDSDKLLPMEVFIFSPGPKNTYIVLKSSKNMLDFVNIRSVQFEVRDNIFNGIKIPNDSIIEKTLLKIPNSYIVKNLDQEEGVIKKGELADEFVPVVVKSYDEEEDCSYVLQNMSVLKIGDTIKASNEPDALPYQITEVSTVKGVYVVNSSITEFKKISEILGSNSDYSIVQKNNLSYYVQQYDRIVSDAKTINDSEMIY